MDDPKHWRDRAEEMRALAEKAGDEESKPIARDYDKLSQRALERSAGIPH